MRVELRQEEEVLASWEMPPESSLLEMVRELISEGEWRFHLDTGGGRSHRTIGHLILLGHCINIIMFCCLVMVCECVKYETSVRKLGRGEEKEVKRRNKRS